MRLFVLAYLCGSAVAGAVPLASKFSTTGTLVKPEYARSETCEIYPDHVVVRVTYGLVGGRTTTVVREHALTLDGIFTDLLADVAHEPVDTAANASCGYPTTLALLGNGLVLYDSGGCGKPRLFRNGGASSAVRDLLDGYCAKTYY